MKTKVSIVAFLFAVFAFVPAFFVGAETISSTGTVVATAGVYDLKILSQKDNVFTLGFTILNREGIQPAVIYRVKLIRQDEYQVVVDQKAYADDVLTLKPGESIQKEITYVAPVQLSGKYFLQVQVTNPDGFRLGFISSPEISLKASEKGILADTSTCFLTVAPEKTHYLPEEGIDFLATETLTAHCALSNNFTANTSVTPVFETRYRSVSGKVMGTVKGDAIALLPGKTFDFSADVPKMSEPQAYDAILTFVDGAGKPVSSPIAFHYVLKGQNATINNLVLDKDYYAKGDTALLTLTWSGPADNFGNSRLKPTVLPKETTLKISVMNSENKSCIPDFSKVIDMSESGGVEKISLPINKDCPNPAVSVKIADAAGKALAENSYDIASKDIPASVPAQKDMTLIALFSALLILCAIGLIAYFAKKKKSAIPPIAIFLALVLGFGLFFFGEEVKAVTRTVSFTLHSYGGWEGNYSTNFYYDLDSASRIYSRGATMTISGSVDNGPCDNTAGGNMAANVYGSLKTFMNQGVSPAGGYNPDGTVIHSVYGYKKTSNTYTVPTTPGYYAVDFDFYHKLYNHSSWLRKSGGNTYYGTDDGNNLIPFGGQSGGAVITISYTVIAPACGGQAKTYAASATGWLTDGSTKCNPEAQTVVGMYRSPSGTIAFPAAGSSVSWTCGDAQGSVSCTANHLAYANCTRPWGGTLAHGSSITAYQSSSVVSPATCTSQSRTCNNGSLSGSYTNQSCTVTPAGCTLPWGGTIANGSSVTAYSAPSVNSPALCSSIDETRTCNNGSLSGSYTNQNCSELARCTLPWGGTIANGSSVTAYSAPSVNLPTLCSSIDETRTCNDGFLSGSYTNQNCSEKARCTLPWGGTIANGTSVTAYSATSVIAPATCASIDETRTCNDGSLSGAYTNQTCAARCNIPPELGGGTLAINGTIDAYQSSTAILPTTCASLRQTRTCLASGLSGSYLNPTCGEIAISCGSAADTTEPTKPKTNLCSDGSTPPVTLQGGKWKWTCGGVVSCESPKGKFNFVES